MSRLTEDDIIDILAISIVVLHGNKLLTKITEMAADLLEYKKLEQRLDCSLDVLINACTNGFIAKWYGDWENEELHINDRDIVVDFKRKCFTDNYANEYFWKDYKKTWWLKEPKEE